MVVGAGLAGAQTVAALRAHGFDGHLTVLGAEALAPYDRPPLSKQLLDRTEPAWLADDLGIDLADLADDTRLAASATALHLTSTGVALTTTHDAVHADAVVLACGSHAVRPAGWESALTLHTAADATRLRAALVPGARLVVVGAGWIGAEVAGVAARAGVRVTVVEAGSAPLARQLGEQVGTLTAPWYDAAGVRLLTDARVDAIDAGGVRLTGGDRLAADVVLVAVGAVPSTDWLRGTVPLTARGAIPVDASGRLDPARGAATDGSLSRATAARVWAVGDCADRMSAHHGEVPGGHWSAALADPETLACAFTGATPPAESAPYVFSDQLGHHLTLTGSPGEAADVVHRGDPGDPAGWTTLWLAPADAAGDPGRALLAVLTVDRPRDVGPARRLLGAPLPPRVDVTRAVDPSVPLRAAAVG